MGGVGSQELNPLINLEGVLRTTELPMAELGLEEVFLGVVCGGETG